MSFAKMQRTFWVMFGKLYQWKERKEKSNQKVETCKKISWKDKRRFTEKKKKRKNSHMKKKLIQKFPVFVYFSVS